MEKMIVDKLMELVDTAIDADEVPIAAVIVKDNNIIAVAHNRTEKLGSVLGHAEIQAIELASKELNTWHLDGCELYVTLEPCDMCWGAIRNARIKTVFYLAKSHKSITFKTNSKQIANSQLETQYVEKLQSFFEKKR